MKENQHELVKLVMAAREDGAAADRLIERYMGFIRSETAKVIGRPPHEGDDELSIAMLAFYEAVLAYNRLKGSFLGLAATAIRNRIIDHQRKERRHQGHISIYEPQGEMEDIELVERLADPRSEIEEWELRHASQAEIAEFSRDLGTYGITLSDVADSCPRQARTMEACMAVLAYAKTHGEVLDELMRTKRLPMTALVKGSGCDKKTLERHRKYLVAILLAYTNGYEIIRGHLCRISPEKGVRA